MASWSVKFEAPDGSLHARDMVLVGSTTYEHRTLGLNEIECNRMAAGVDAGVIPGQPVAKGEPMWLVDRLAFVRAFVACWTVAAATAAYAQFDSVLLDMTPAEAVRTAFEQPYGKALVAEAAKVFRRSADPRCLAEKKLDELQLEAKARELLVRYGTRMSEAYMGLIDMKKLEAALETRAGPGAKDEIARLRSAPEVAEFNKLSAPARLVSVAEHILEGFERYLVIHRLRLAGDISPLVTGDDRLVKMSQEAEKSMEPLLAGKHPAALARYLELSEIIGEEYAQAFDRQGMLRLNGPQSFFRGVEAELAELCLPGKN